MPRKHGSKDANQRARSGRRGAWNEAYRSDPNGEGGITVTKLPLRILAALESIGEAGGISVQDVIRRDFAEKYSENEESV